MQQEIKLLNNTLFANSFKRVVHGERGDYVEFERDQIIPNLLSKFNNDLSGDTEYYYFWLYPETDKNTKVYFQLKTVKYADYKVGLYYVSPAEFLNFKDPEKLFY